MVHRYPLHFFERFRHSQLCPFAILKQFDFWTLSWLQTWLFPVFLVGTSWIHEVKRDYYSDSFFYPHELTKIVLKSSTKYYCTKLHHLAQRTEPKMFLLFFHVTYHTGRDQRVPSFNFFGIVRYFFENKNFPPSIFWCFATEWMLKNAKGSLLSVFRHCETFFRKFDISPKGPPDNCDENVDNFERVILLARQELAQAGPGAPLGPFFLVFQFSRTAKENTWHLEVLLLFMCLGYLTDLCLSRLVLCNIDYGILFRKRFCTFLSLCPEESIVT